VNEKLLLLDIDGVILKSPEQRFSIRLAERQQLKIDQITPFFEGEYIDCLTGRSNLVNVLPEYMKVWGWTETMEDLLKFWFVPEAKINQKVIETISNLRNQNIKVALASNKTEQHARFLLDDLGLKNIFDTFFMSYQVGYIKSDQQFFRKVTEQLGTETSRILFWDDDQENVNAAKLAGFDARLFKQGCRFDLDKFLCPEDRS
jgi:putative hydrolase of the HAD superfamily